MNTNKNEKLLKSFTEYCEANPELTFWQALRNWSGWAFIYAGKYLFQGPGLFDTYYWEENKKVNEETLE